MVAPTTAFSISGDIVVSSGKNVPPHFILSFAFDDFNVKSTLDPRHDEELEVASLLNSA